MVCRPGVGSRDRFAGLLITAGSGRWLAGWLAVQAVTAAAAVLPRINAINWSARFLRVRPSSVEFESVLVHDGVFM